MTYSFKCPYCGCTGGVLYTRRAILTEVSHTFLGDGSPDNLETLRVDTLELEACCIVCKHPLDKDEIQHNLRPVDDE